MIYAVLSGKCFLAPKKYCHVFYLHVATIRVDSPDLTREFI
jgi:hypothetical protein